MGAVADRSSNSTHCPISITIAAACTNTRFYTVTLVNHICNWRTLQGAALQLKHSCHEQQVSGGILNNTSMWATHLFSISLSLRNIHVLCITVNGSTLLFFFSFWSCMKWHANTCQPLVPGVWHLHQATYYTLGLFTRNHHNFAMADKSMLSAAHLGTVASVFAPWTAK